MNYDEKYELMNAELYKVIEQVKQEEDLEKREILFEKVMPLAWELDELFHELNPYVFSHPREYTYRELCGFPKEVEQGSSPGFIEGHKYQIPLFKIPREHKG
jgi:hypothetical protein